MRNALITIAIAAAVGVAAYFAASAPARAEAARAARAGDAMAWLRAEFRLSDAQFTAISKLHDTYGVACAIHCDRILAARARNAPAAERAALEEECVKAMDAHFRAVAALMSPSQGERYLATVLPRIDRFAHAGPPNAAGSN